MGVMGIPTRALLSMTLVLLCGSAVVAVFDGYDGLPRPQGMDQDPTTTYGAKPAVKYENKVANCIWYGWENGYYPPEGTKNCSTSLWTSLSAANPAGLSGFMYYVPLDDAYFDPLYNEYLCAIGCFDLTASGPASPSTADPPVESPPVESPPVALPPAALPPVVAAPPPAETTAPPSDGALVPPPQATLFRPPPPAPPLPPSPTPALVVQPPIESPPSPGISPETSPASSPGSIPIFGPGTSPGPVSGGPTSSVVQGSSATTTSVSTVLVFTAALFLSINFLV